ncbi:MAG: D-tyrosyl-tRNA(Tyr) deacylase [Bacteriovoracaceae bacterium]|jgi:D-aminoacyl-tRNA deacylase|nr:D-tyrosyl-tRNA(Tyr) deacylase [Bacteriovoracaceae bacterium]
MKVLVQRVKSSKVVVEDAIVGQIEHGLSLLVCLEKGDDLKKVESAAGKIASLRVFADDNGKMNLNIEQVQGEILAISQFTLSWDGKKGNRPSFEKSLEPGRAKILFHHFCKILSSSAKVETGEFGSHMEVSILGDGPVTFHLDF